MNPQRFRSHSSFLPWLDWRWSLLLPLGVLLVLATLLVSLVRSEPPVFTVNVHSSVTGGSVEGAVVRVGADEYRSDTGGQVRLLQPAPGATIEVFMDGYRAVAGTVDSTSALQQRVVLHPAIVQGTVRDAASGEPIPGAVVAAIDGSGMTVGSATTTEDGSYLIRNVPAGTTLRVETDEFGSYERRAQSDLTADFALDHQVVSGRILDSGGSPIQGAIVQSGQRRAVSTGDGTFELAGATFGTDVTVVASGYEDRLLTIPESMHLADVELVPQIIRGVYANLTLLATEGGLEQLIDIANTTEINAIVIDIKQDTIYYDSQVQFFQDAGTVRPVYDIRQVLAKLEENNIYAIARMVVFQDPLVAEARPDLAVMDESGDLWRNEMGVAWVSAFNEELWDANIELALEALDYGFDEIQYDYVRFPSDGDLRTADFGRDYTADAREAAITSFMRRSYEAIHAADGKLAADLFGFVTLVDDEQYIGQRFTALEPYLDYVCMMIYPSHFEEGNIASAPGHPNDYPYETIFESLERAEQLVPGSKAKFRPWLQDFNYGGMRPYTARDVRAQIDAAEDFGASGWMLWGDPFNITIDALRPVAES